MTCRYGGQSQLFVFTLTTAALGSIRSWRPHGGGRAWS